MMLAVPLFVGWLMIGALVVVQAAAITAIMRLIQRETRRENRSIRWLRGVTVFSRALLLIVLAQLVEIAAWAALFLAVGEFNDLPTAFYHSAMNFTTLGYGDIVMSREWRLLGPLEAVAGMLMFGISTAVLFAVIQTLTRLREDGLDERRGSHQRSAAIHLCIVAALALFLGHGESPGRTSVGAALLRPDRRAHTRDVHHAATGAGAVFHLRLGSEVDPMGSGSSVADFCAGALRVRPEDTRAAMTIGEIR
jgi:hypothetical protein